MKKLLKKFIASVALGFLFFSNSAAAEIKIIDAVGEYTMDKEFEESPKLATEHAREKAWRRAVEEAGFTLKSSSVIINNNLTDKIEVTAQKYIEILEEKVEPVIDESKNIKMICRIKARIDTDRIDPAQIGGSELQDQTIAEKDKLVAEKDAEIEKWKNLYENAVTEKQKLEIKNEFDKSQKQFLIAKYERDLNIFDFDAAINWQAVYDTSQKLSELDALNPTAFRAAIYYYREQGDLKTAMDYCKRILQTNCPADTAIEANTQLGDMYYNEFDDKENAKKFINAGIALVKKTYSKAEIEKFVNGTNFELKDLELIGKTNTVRELYVLKSAIENILPKNISSESTMKEMELTDRVKVQYRIDW